LNYVKEYLRLDKSISEAETRAETDKWKMCRIAYEATQSGGFSAKSFADAVGKSSRTISRLVRIWDKYGEAAPASRPSYADAFAEEMDRPTGDDRKTDMQRRVAGGLPAKDKAKLVDEWTADPEVARHIPKGEPIPSFRDDFVDDIAAAHLKLVTARNLTREAAGLLGRQDRVGGGAELIKGTIGELRSALDLAEAALDGGGVTDETLQDWMAGGS